MCRHLQSHSSTRIEAGEIDPSFVVTHPASLEDAPEMYKKFRDKKDGVIKVVLRPGQLKLERRAAGRTLCVSIGSIGAPERFPPRPRPAAEMRLPLCGMGDRLPASLGNPAREPRWETPRIGSVG